jgi:glycine/D-amino acid oxidase-like deaminating enzyme
VLEHVVLAAGAGCRRLWPALPPRLRVSWAGVLALARNPGGSPWLDLVRRGRVVQPARWRRPDLDRRAARPGAQAWVVDAGLAPWGAEGVLLGQISLLRRAEVECRAPDPVRMEDRLRRELARLDPALAALPGPYRQVPVPFCSDGVPLVGPVEGAPGLWAFTGFSGAFAIVPPLADRLAEVILDGESAAGAAASDAQKRKR